MRLFRIASLATLAALVTVGIGTSSAVAQDEPVINFAHSDSNELGTLLVSVTGTYDVTTITAHIVVWATEQEVALVDEFTLRSGTLKDGIWASDPILLDELGGYRVDVEVTDAAGHHVSRIAAGELNYGVVTSFVDVRLSPKTVTYTDREVTFSGRLVGVWPGTGAVGPIAGETVYVIPFPSPVIADAVTAADGSFSATVTISGVGDVRAEYGGDIFGRYLRANSEAVPGAINPADTHLSVSLSSSRVNYNEPCTVSGQLTWKSPSGWQPMPNALVAVFMCDPGEFCFDQQFVTSDANGRYEATFSAFQTGLVRAGFAPEDPFLAWTSKSTSIVVIQPTEMIDFTAVRDENGDVSVLGHLEFGGSSTPGTMPVKIQFSGSGSGPWRTVTVFDAAQWWDGTGFAFFATLDNFRSGYWRAVYEGTPTDYAPATSAVVFVE